MLFYNKLSFTFCTNSDRIYLYVSKVTEVRKVELL